MVELGVISLAPSLACRALVRTGPGADGPWIGSGLLRRADLARLRGDGSFVANMRWRAWLTWPCPRSPADTLVHTINSIITVPHRAKQIPMATKTVWVDIHASSAARSQSAWHHQAALRPRDGSTIILLPTGQKRSWKDFLGR